MRQSDINSGSTTRVFAQPITVLIRTSSLIFNMPKCNSTCPKSTTMNGFITRRNIPPKFQLVHLGKLAENQLARSQNLLVMDERTSV